MTFLNNVKSALTSVGDFVIAVKRSEIETNIDLAKKGYVSNPSFKGEDGFTLAYTQYDPNDPVCLERVKMLEEDLKQYPQMEQKP